MRRRPGEGSHPAGVDWAIIAFGGLALAGAVGMWVAPSAPDDPQAAGPPQAPEDAPAPLTLTTEGSATGLGVTVGVLLEHVDRLDAEVAALLGVPGLEGPLDQGAWRRAQNARAAIPGILVRLRALSGRAELLRDSVEVRYGHRLGKPWLGLARSFDLLEETLRRVPDGDPVAFAEGVDRYDQWHRTALFVIQEQLEDKGAVVEGGGLGEPTP